MWRSGRAAFVSGALLAALVTSVWLRYHPLLEAQLLPLARSAPLRPWWSTVLALAFLGSATPQLDLRRKRVDMSDQCNADKPYEQTAP